MIVFLQKLVTSCGVNSLTYDFLKTVLLREKEESQFHAALFVILNSKNLVCDPVKLFVFQIDCAIVFTSEDQGAPTPLRSNSLPNCDNDQVS